MKDQAAFLRASIGFLRACLDNPDGIDIKDQHILDGFQAMLRAASPDPEQPEIYSKRKTSSLSSDRLMIEADIGDSYEVRAWNFTKKEWMRSTRVMRKTTFHANYEPETTAEWRDL